MYALPGANRVGTFGCIWDAGGIDRLDGGAGSDKLIGGLGADRLTGGEGADHFVFASAAEIVPDSTRDITTDLGRGLERIDLQAIDANVAVGGSPAFTLDTGGSFAAGEVRQATKDGHLVLLLHTDSDAQTEMSILLLGGNMRLLASDLILRGSRAAKGGPWPAWPLDPEGTRS